MKINCNIKKNYNIPYIVCRWLTLEYNEIDTLPNTMDNLEALVHCNLRHNSLKEFPTSLLKCGDLMFLQLNHNQVIV